MYIYIYIKSLRKKTCKSLYIYKYKYKIIDYMKNIKKIPTSWVNNVLRWICLGWVFFNNFFILFCFINNFI